MSARFSTGQGKWRGFHGHICAENDTRVASDARARLSAEADARARLAAGADARARRAAEAEARAREVTP